MAAVTTVQFAVALILGIGCPIMCACMGVALALLGESGFARAFCLLAIFSFVTSILSLS